MEKNQKGEHGVITNVVGASHFEGGYESFNDAIKAMVGQWERLSGQEQVSIKGQDYRNEVGVDYMIAVSFFDEETGVAWEAMTLAEVIEMMEWHNTITAMRTEE